MKIFLLARNARSKYHSLSLAVATSMGDSKAQHKGYSHSGGVSHAHGLEREIVLEDLFLEGVSPPELLWQGLRAIGLSIRSEMCLCRSEWVVREERLPRGSRHSPWAPGAGPWGLCGLTAVWVLGMSQDLGFHPRLSPGNPLVVSGAAPRHVASVSTCMKWR